MVKQLLASHATVSDMVSLFNNYIYLTQWLQPDNCANGFAD